MSRTAADYSQLDQLAQRLSQMSAQVADLRAGGDSVVNTTLWEGNSAARFREFWAEFSRDLARASEILTSGSSETRNKAEQYRLADA
jgi:WXG100 family type VII secretion target